MTYEPRKFSYTGETVFPLGLGTHGHGHAFGGISHEQSNEVFEKLRSKLAPEAKILIDTAPRYGLGRVEGWLGECILPDDQQILIATKGGRHITPERDNQKDFSATYLRSGLEDSLTRLRRESIFLFQLHNPSLEQIVAGKIFEEPERMRQEGLIQWYGVSVNTPEEGLAALETKARDYLHGLVSLQVIYSPITHGGIGVLLERAEELSVAVISREVIMRGFLTDAYPAHQIFQSPPSAIRKLLNLYGSDQISDAVEKLRKLASQHEVSLLHAALRYSLQNPRITVTLVGIDHPKYFEETWDALNDRLPNELFQAIDSSQQLTPMKR